MDESQDHLRYLLAIQERWVFISLAVLLAIGGAIAYSELKEDRYEASADVLVSPVGADTLVGLPVLRESPFGRSVVTAARLTQSPQVASRAGKALNMSIHASKLDTLIRVTPQEQSSIVTITGTAASAEDAARIANAFARALLAERSERLRKQVRRVVTSLSRRLRSIDDTRSPEATALSNRIADYRALYDEEDPTLELVSPALPATEPAGPSVLFSVAIAVMIGLAIGIGTAVALEFGQPIVLRAESLMEEQGAPVLARLREPTTDDVRATFSDPDKVPSNVKEPIRTLWASLRTATQHRGGRTFLFTQSDDRLGDERGSVATAALLAASMARGGERVVLLDADLTRRPLSSMVDGDVPSVVSVGKALASVTDGSSTAVDQPSSRLAIVLARPDDRHVPEWLPPDRLAALVGELAKTADAVVVSAPPLPAAETTVLADIADAVVITVELGRTRRRQLARLRTAFTERGVVPAGYVVLERRSLFARMSRGTRAKAARWSS